MIRKWSDANKIGFHDLRNCSNEHVILGAYKGKEHTTYTVQLTSKNKSRLGISPPTLMYSRYMYSDHAFLLQL